MGMFSKTQGAEMLSRSRWPAFVLVLAVFGTSACTSRLAVTAREGEAFIVRAAAFKSYVYRCEVVGTDPVCTRVQEVQ
jgi:hypothetical protein